MDSLESTLFGILFNKRDKVVGNDTVNGYLIDTCYTIDQGWETAVCYKENDWIIVARYPDRAMAEQGHKNWVETCTTNMPTHAFSVQNDCLESFMGE